MLKIVLKRSCIGVPEKQRRIVYAMGLRKTGYSVRQPDTKSTWGMINKVSHLVSVEKIRE